MVHRIRIGTATAFLVTAPLLICGCEFDLGDNTDEADPAAAEVASASEATPSSVPATADAPATETSPAAPDGPILEYEELAGRGSVALPVNDGGGGFVSNPENSRGTLKFVWPKSYSDQISSVNTYAPGGGLFDGFYRELPNEHDGRPRYYGTRGIAEYPDNLSVRVVFVDGTVGTLTLPNPQQRYD